MAEPDIHQPVSDQIRDAIDASGLSRYRICKLIDLPESTMSHFMSGSIGLSLATIDRLGRLLRFRLVMERPAGAAVDAGAGPATAQSAPAGKRKKASKASKGSRASQVSKKRS